MVFDRPMYLILALYLGFEGAKNIHVLLVLIWGFERHWRFLTGAPYFDLELDIVTGLWYTNGPNFGPLSWLWWCKEHPYPLSPDFVLWRMLKVPDWGRGSWSWFEYGHWSLIQKFSKFWLSVLILKAQRTSMSFKSSFVALEDAGGSWLGFGILILIWIWSLVFDIPLIWILALNFDFGGAKNIHVL